MLSVSLNKVFGYRFPNATNSPAHVQTVTLCCPISLNPVLARKKHLMSEQGKETPKAQHSTEMSFQAQEFSTHSATAFN